MCALREFCQVRRVKNGLIQNLLSDGVLVLQRLQKFIQWHYIMSHTDGPPNRIRGRHFMDFVAFCARPDTTHAATYTPSAPDKIPVVHV